MGNCTIDRIEEAVEYGESFNIRVEGESMLPLLGRAGDVIIVRRIHIDEPIVGRIAMCRVQSKHYVTHRVIKRDAGMVIMRGDGRLTFDDPVERESIVGIVEGVIRQNGKRESCLSRYWRLRERLWLAQPIWMRRITLGIIRRWNRLTN